MQRVPRLAPLLVFAVLLGGTTAAARAQSGGDPSFRERVYARTLGQLASPTTGAEVRRVQRAAPSAAVAGRGVEVTAPGLRVTRLRFSSPAAAADYARSVPRGLVEARGDQVVVLDGPRVADRARAESLRDAAWGTLPAPDAPASVRRYVPPASPPAETSRPATRGGRLGRSDAPAAPTTVPRPEPPPAASKASPRPASQPRPEPRKGIEDVLRESLDLDPSPNGPRATSPGGVAGPAPSGTPRERVAAAVEGAGDGLTPHHRSRAIRALEALTPEQQAAVADLVGGQAEPAARAALLKALGAGSTLDEMAWLAEELEGKSAEWIDTNTRLTGDRGAKQQFADSCVPTTVQAIRGEYDPIYALRTRQTNDDVHDVDEGDPARLNPDLAREQREALERHHGVAVPRNSAGGRGVSAAAWAAMLKDVQGATGLDYVPLDTTNDPQRALDVLDEHLPQGRVVPLAINDGKSRGGHAIVATNLRREGDGSTSYLIYEPYEGRADWIPADVIRENRLSIGDWDRVFKVLVPREAS